MVKQITEINKSLVKSGIIVSIVILLTISVYLYIQRKKSTTQVEKTFSQQSNLKNNIPNWKTYSNYGFEIKYPWRLARIEQQPVNKINGNSRALSIGPGDKNINEIRIWGFNKTGLTLDEAFYYLSKGLIVKEKTYTSINNYPAIRYLFTNDLMESSSGNLGILLKNPFKDEAYAIFTQVKFTENNGKHEISKQTTDLFNKIVSNFKYQEL